VVGNEIVNHDATEELAYEDDAEDLLRQGIQPLFSSDSAGKQTDCTSFPPSVSWLFDSTLCLLSVCQAPLKQVGTPTSALRLISTLSGAMSGSWPLHVPIERATLHTLENLPSVADARRSS
jgi:hypothetical protein